MKSLGLIKFAFISMLILITQPLCAQKEINFKFDHIDVEYGLSHNTVSSVVKDDLGFIWIGTNDGLNRYDSKNNFTVFKADDSSIKGGLKSSVIRTLYKDSTGLLWIGTRLGGLSCYNVYTDSWMTYRHSDEIEGSISNDEILSIKEDSKGRLWVGTENGLNLFDRNTGFFQRFYPDTTNPKALQARAILTIEEDHEGRLWVGAWDGGLYLLIPDSKEEAGYVFRQFFPSLNQRSRNVWKLYQDSKQRFWVGTQSGGIYQMELPDSSVDLEKWTPRFAKVKSSVKGDESFDSVKDIHEDKDGAFWIGTFSGLTYVNKEEFSKIPSRLPQAHTKEEQDIVLNNLTLRHDDKDRSTITNDNISSIYEDDLGILWVSTFSGLCQLNKSANQFDLYELDKDLKIVPNSQFIYVRSNGVAWIGNRTKGIIKYDINSRTEIPLEDKLINILKGLEVTAVSSVDDINLLVGTTSSILEINMENGSLRSFPFPQEWQELRIDFSVRKIFKDSRSRIWVGTDSGLYKIDQNSGNYEAYYHIPADLKSLSDNSITDILETGNGQIWVGTFKGLNQVVESNNGLSFLSYLHDSEDENSIPSNHAMVLKDFNDQIFIGTTNGLCSYSQETKSFKNYSKDDNKYNVVGLEISNNNSLWASTTEGIVEYNVKHNSWKLYNEKDGIGDSAFLGSVSQSDRNGFLYFGSSKGFIKFHPQRIKKNKVVPPVYITNVKVLGASTSRNMSAINKKDLTLNHDDYYIAIDFAGLNYIHPEKNQIEYKLDGFDENWIDAASSQRAIYTNLKHGNYQFKVRASNNDGYWNEKGSDIHIKVKAAYWETWFFRIAILLIAVSLFVAGIRFYTKKSEQRSVELKLYNDKLNTEIEERESFQKALQEREVFLRLIIDNIPQYIFWIDKEGKFQGANKSFLDFVGIKNEAEIIGKNYSHVIEDQTIIDHRIALEDEILRSGNSKMGVIKELPAYEGHPAKFLEENNIALKNDRDETIGILVSGQDITAKVRAKEILKLHSDRLENLVEKRTIELESKNNEIQSLLNEISVRNEELEILVEKRTENLQESNRELKRSNHDLEQFAYIASHDLQEPLRIIGNFVGLLGRRYKDKLDETGFEYIHYATDAAKRMSNLIQSILTYSQVGKRQIDLKVTDTNVLIESKLIDLRQKIAANNVELQIFPLPEIMCESAQVGMVFYNLINNAIKFNKSEIPVVKVEAHEASEEGFWKFSVKDNGIGIAPKFKQKIFEIFRRLHNKQDYDGTGIGLAVCQKIVERHGGKIWIESVEGEGTTFFFTIAQNLEHRASGNDGEKGTPKIYELEN